MEEDIKVKSGDFVQLEDGTIVKCCTTNLNKNYSCDICYFRDKGYNCAIICPAIGKCHFKRIKVIRVNNFKPDRLK